MKKTAFRPLAVSLMALSLLASCTNSASSSPVPGSSSSASPLSSSETLVSTNSEITQYTVTFDLNYANSTPIVVKVNKGEKVSSPETPTRTGYLFAGWKAEAEGLSDFVFTTPITADTTVYASWLVQDANTITATFYWNYEGAPDQGIYKVVAFQKGGRMSAPDDPLYEGHTFRGWFKEASCATSFSTISKYSDNVVCYAKWLTNYTFEAEYTQLTGLPESDLTANEYGNKIGHGYSSDVEGLGLIFKDDTTLQCDASNGYFITDLYYNGAFLEFDITSDRTVNDAILIARLSAEYFNMDFDSSNYKVEVNGTAISYNPIAINNVITGRDSARKRAFTNFNLTNALTLKQGANVIKLITANSTRHDTTGTMAAEAPMVDCLYAYSEAALTFDAHKSNIK